jgi:colanic acid/amylovoran biosynthesis glycosyltransferase
VRIAFLPGNFPMLSETPVLNQITGLVKRGHEVDIFGDRPKTPSGYHPSIDELNLLARAYYRPDFPESTPGRWRQSMQLLSQARGKDRTALLRSMNFLRFGTRSATGRLPLQTAQFLPVRNYDIIQGGFGEQGLKGLRMKRVGAIQGKLVTAFRGADISLHLRSRGSSVYDRLFREGDLFLPVCHAFQVRLEQLGCPRDRIQVHRTGIDLTRFEYQPVTPAPTLQLVSIGRLVEKKGLEDGLLAVSALQKSGNGVSYTIVGDGPLRSRLETTVRELGLPGVVFTGAVQQTEVSRYLARADILLVPSVTASNGDEEGIPNVIKEAMALGRIVIGTRHSGIPELVENGVTGMLTEERDHPALSRAVMHLMTHAEIWPSIQDAARKKVEQEYDIERLNDQLVERYRELTT